MNLVKELQLIDLIESISEEYENEYGNKPINISHWDPAESTVENLLLSTMPSATGNGADYIFTYTLPNHAHLQRSLNYLDSRWRCVISHSGSANIVMTCNWLRIRGAKKILIITPRYFTVPHCLSAMRITFEISHCKRSIMGYRIPKDIDIDCFDGIWLTNPVYGTSVYPNPEDIIELSKICHDKEKFFILDECLAKVDRYIGNRIEPHYNTVVIASPHKNICVNAFKFAVNMVDKSQLKHYEHWSDIWLGSLPQSSYQAIEHFCSGGYHTYQTQFNAKIAESNSKFVNVTKLFPAASLDENADGYLRSVYFPKIPSSYGLNYQFLRKSAFGTGATFIPGIRNELDPSTGLSFRVNLAAFNEEAMGSYVRLLEWLSN